MSLTDRLNEFTSRQGIVSAEWCKLLDEVEKLQEQNKIFKEALELISETDISSSVPDMLWLNRWRNNTKERAREALAKVGDR